MPRRRFWLRSRSVPNRRWPVKPINSRAVSIFAVLASLTLAAPAASTDVGKNTVTLNEALRISILTPTLVRIEEKGPKGFEDRNTFLVVERSWPGAVFKVAETGGETRIRSDRFEVRVAKAAKSIEDVSIRDPVSGKLLWRGARPLPAQPVFPDPATPDPCWAVADSPRVVPPPWGACPPPDDARADSGWDLSNDAADVYVFVHGGDLKTWRQDFLKLTGRVPMPPLWAFGFWNSLYHPYTEQEALQAIDEYRAKDYPLDVFVVDTEWRKGGSGGYDVETNLFPNMARFIAAAHDRHAHIVFNDHPQPNGMKPLEPRMLRYRHDGLTGFLSMGLDAWWYDQNWFEIIDGPVDGIDRRVWGEYLYHSIMAQFRPGRRVMTMSMRSDHPASHRFPIWWTGDIPSTWEALRTGIADSVDGGLRLMPYISQDLGGFQSQPDDELYVRFLEYGSLSPITRVHGDRSEKIFRYPWRFGEEAARIVREYVQLRYRFLPTIYAAARRAYDDGTPVLRKLCLEWPALADARASDEYLLGDDLLVAPLCTMPGHEVVPAGVFAPKGLHGEYFANTGLTGMPAVVRTDSTIDFDWISRPPPGNLGANYFSVRWTGTLTPRVSGRHTISTISDDGIRVWLGGKLVIDHWAEHGSALDAADLALEAGESVPLRVEYWQKAGGAETRLLWSEPGAKAAPARSVWIPPGAWEDAWTGEIVSGPRQIEAACPLEKTPLYVRRGGILLMAPAMNFVKEKPWDVVTADVYPPEQGEVVRELYEDDGESLGYQRGECSRTKISVTVNPGRIAVRISPSEGAFAGQIEKRVWQVRVHLEPGVKIAAVLNDGKELSDKDFRVLNPAPADTRMVLKGWDDPPRSRAGDIVELSVTVNKGSGRVIEFKK